MATSEPYVVSVFVVSNAWKHGLHCQPTPLLIVSSTEEEGAGACSHRPRRRPRRPARPARPSMVAWGAFAAGPGRASSDPLGQGVGDVDRRRPPTISTEA
ncbi:unnamed protein product [Prorocentrum cordatum]|uniref:Uncharacterized protein n=1 Tax=Prorocentrum cordatum TaxID=2364126 RepID=A0ABN9VHK1_9DINO|nr:unnamed protein product [Polarella glacialis]